MGKKSGQFDREVYASEYKSNCCARIFILCLNLFTLNRMVDTIYGVPYFKTKSQIIPNNNSYLVSLNVAVIDVVGFVVVVAILPLLLHLFSAECTTRGSQLKRIACMPIQKRLYFANTLVNIL